MGNRGRVFLENTLGWLQILEKPEFINKLSGLSLSIKGFLFCDGEDVLIRNISTEDMPELQIPKISGLQEELALRLLKSSAEKIYQPKGDYEPANENIQGHINNTYHLSPEEGKVMIDKLDSILQLVSPPPEIPTEIVRLDFSTEKKDDYFGQVISNQNKDSNNQKFSSSGFDINIYGLKTLTKNHRERIYFPEWQYNIREIKSIEFHLFASRFGFYCSIWDSSFESEDQDINVWFEESTSYGIQVSREAFTEAFEKEEPNYSVFRSASIVPAIDTYLIIKLCFDRNKIQYFLSDPSYVSRALLGDIPLKTEYQGNIVLGHNGRGYTSESRLKKIIVERYLWS